MFELDFNDAPEQQTRGPIPAKTQVPVILTVVSGDLGPQDSFSVSKTGLIQLKVEATVTEGQYKGRKVWQTFFVGGLPDAKLSDGQKKAIDSSKATVRAFLEVKHGLSPRDFSDAAKAKRKLSSGFDLDNIECWIEVGIDKGSQKEDGTFYADRNRIDRVINPLDKTAATSSPANGNSAVGDGAATRPTGGSKAAWA